MNNNESNNIVPIKEKEVNQESKTLAMETYNPATGNIVTSPVSDNDVKALSDLHFDKFIYNSENILDNDDLKKLFPDAIGDDIEDIKKVNELIKRKNNGQKITYEELPKFLKNSVINIVSKSLDDNTPSFAYMNNKTQLNYIANLVIGQLVEEYNKKNTNFDIDTMLAGFDESIDKLQIETSKEFGDILMSFDEERKKEINNAIERCKREGKEEAVEKFQKIKNVIDEAYNLDKFSEFCKHVKIKKFDIEKPKRIFLSFNTKYMNHTNNINDIQYCPVVLDRHNISDHNSNMKLCLAFCKYCMNYSPDNIEEHTFMYYFIKNIILLDRINPKGKIYDTLDERSKNFYDGFINNILKCINNINNKTL